MHSNLKLFVFKNLCYANETSTLLRLEAEMTLRTKSILAPNEASDGIRLSVMSRHTLDDGVTPDKRITASKFDGWLTELAPPPHLVGSYLRGEITWAKYRDEYLKFLREPQNLAILRALASLACTCNVTLLCEESSPTRCHRRLLARECAKHSSKLKTWVR